ncbi:MAG TPA: hypothetical protein VM598_01105, partial [Bdellovibrionota bacterium]|nr:hypothetical protein [Bdellovibrionota bacterium]
ALQLDDFRPANWILEAGQVRSIDMNSTVGMRMDLGSSGLPVINTPLGGLAAEEPGLQILLARRASPETRAFLLDLTPERLERFIAESGFHAPRNYGERVFQTIRALARIGRWE